MNAKSCCIVLTTGLITATLPALAAQGSYSPSSQAQTQSSQQQTPIRGRHEAMKMVPAHAVFTSTLKSEDAHPGAACNVELTKEVTLNDGTKLPGGTKLQGQVVTDNTQPGQARIALRFDEAQLKNGQTIPVKATIVGIYESASRDSMDPRANDPNAIPPSWNDGTLQIDQIGALPGIDLHSKIASSNSGVFVSSKKNDIKLSPEYSLTLAIGPGQQGRTSMSSTQSTYSQH